MKYSYFLIFFLGMVLLISNKAFANSRQQYRSVISCKMTGGDKVILKKLEPIGNNAYLEIDGKEYLATGDKPYLEINGKTSLAFDKDITYGEWTELILVRCIRHTLVVIMDFGSPYPRGLAIRQNPITHQYERIDFGQKSLPTALYFKNNEWGVILPNIENGYYVGKKYLIHFYKAGKNLSGKQDHMKGTNSFPVPKKDLVYIPLPKEYQ
ncbi:hypothetical protein [Commensalibacter communis]|uniref:hypothetical protein n=1 Tax=Commensalibacter communis TaxID=2972786 RepID=UPI0022FF5BC3|nr:hypothetical protein [Commensalibacter communis]CAI3959113.1 unnamed protein product [Commensalibacter communis]CAI3959267.1 unnamed protein product [Commensalibacter communis]